MKMRIKYFRCNYNVIRISTLKRRGHTVGWTNYKSNRFRLRCESDSLWNRMVSMLFGQFERAIKANYGTPIFNSIQVWSRIFESAETSKHFGNNTRKEYFLSVQIVKTDIPLLLFLSSMKKLGMNLDLPHNRVIIKDSAENKKVFKLHVSTTGHYVVPIMEQNPASDIETENETFKQILVAETNSNRIKNKSPQEVAMKLHRQFAHASNQLIRLLNNANIKNKAIFDKLKDVKKMCEFCTKNKRASPTPSVSISLAYSFIEMVSMDLKKINNKWVLHCIDYVTRLSAASSERQIP